MPKGPCYICKTDGHLAAECPEVKFAAELGTKDDSRPPWCGECDERTRTTYDPESDKVIRCRACNPRTGSMQEQFRICGCGHVTYRWDKSECGKHQPVGKRHEPVKSKAS